MKTKWLKQSNPMDHLKSHQPDNCSQSYARVDFPTSDEMPMSHRTGIIEAAVADLQDMCSTALTMSIRAIAARYISNPNINIRITIAMLHLLACLPCQQVQYR